MWNVNLKLNEDEREHALKSELNMNVNMNAPQKSEHKREHEVATLGFRKPPALGPKGVRSSLKASTLHGNVLATKISYILLVLPTVTSLKLSYMQYS